MSGNDYIKKITWQKYVVRTISIGYETYEKIFLEHIFFRYIRHNERTEKVLHVNTVPKDFLGERALPGDEKFRRNNWWRFMLLRYGLAMHYSKGKCILDTCSGLSWGGYLLEGVAKRVTCVEINKNCISTAKNIWKSNIDYICASVLDLPINADAYDIVTAMESIEHFSKDDIKKYLSEIYRVLKPNGILIGSSAFPMTGEEAKKLCSKNKYHKYVCTKDEIESLLREIGFIEVKIFQNRLYFIAEKGNF